MPAKRTFGDGLDLGRASGIRARIRLALQPLADLTNRLWVPVYVSLFTAILAIQIFLPPVVGMADNGDSGRVMGDLGLTPNYPPAERFFAYFAPDYLVTGKPEWSDGPFYTGRLAVRAAEAIGRLKPAGHFDIRWLGFVHLSLYVLCFLLLLRALLRAPALVRYVAPALAIWIFSDVFYASYLNSFYTDTMGFLCYFAMIAAVAAILTEGSPPWAAPLFLLAGVLFAFSKPLNGGCAVVLAPLVAAFGGFSTRGVRRYVAIVAGVAVSFAGVRVAMDTPWLYIYPALVDVVMVRIAKTPVGPAAMREFGLAPSDIRYAGLNAFDPHGAGFDPDFTARFKTTTSADLVRWFLRHPGQTFQFLREDLAVRAPLMRPPLGNFEKHYGLGRLAESHSFSGWSDGRSWMLRIWPFHIVALYLASFGFLLGTLWRRYRSLMGFGVLLASVAILGILQFCSASLLDALETPRHLFMFHVTTDVLILLLACAALWKLSGRSIHR